MQRDVVIVTGGNSGIGFECARQLARDGRHVVIASRNRDASAAAVRRITAESGAEAASAGSVGTRMPVPSRISPVRVTRLA